MTQPPIFIGCASDKRFAEHTAVMLTSLVMNAELPDASFVVAGFGLDNADKALIRAAVGDHALRIVDVQPEMLDEARVERFTTWYPLSVLGRLLVADYVDKPGARMITLDSDMIVNGSLQQLVYRDLGNDYFAAARDAPRGDDSYFNSGLTLFDVDTYRRWDIGHRCLRWLADQRDQPGYPDQDALNHIVGHLWHRLARTWNYFNYEVNGFVAEDYELCRIAHFAGAKPWHHTDHPARPLYERYRAALRQRLDQRPDLQSTAHV
jgi:lipopolysaccharide biosynthesis glycosyltransferase